ncbi:unnamed protein product, partial [Cyprideis torosa]
AFARSDVGRSHKTSGPSEPIIQSLNDAASPFLRRIHPGGLSLDSKNFEEAVYQQPFYNHEPSGPLIASADQIVSGEEDDKETDDHENDEQPDKKENEKEVSVRDREILEFLKALSLIQRGVLKQARQQREDNHSGIASDASVTTSRPSSHLNPELQREDNHSGIASDASVTTSRPSSHLNPELKTAINQTTTAAPSQTSTLKQVRIKRQATDDEETDRRPRLFKRIRSAFGRRQVRATPPPSQATSTTAKSTTKKAEDEAEDQKSMTKSAKDEAEDKKSTTKPAKVEAEDTKSTTKPAKDEAEDKKSTTKPAKVEAEDTTSIAATIKATSPTPTTSATTTTKSSTSTTVNSTEGEHSSHTPGNKPLSGAAVDFYSEAEDPYHQALKNGLIPCVLCFLLVLPTSFSSEVELRKPKGKSTVDIGVQTNEIIFEECLVIDVKNHDSVVKLYEIIFINFYVNCVDVTVKGVDVTVKGVDVTVKGVDVTVKGVDVTVKGVDVTVKGVDVTVKGVDVTLKPIWEAACNEVRKLNMKNPRATMAKVNCEEEQVLCERYGVGKYPTLKIIKFGQVLKREYRKSRTVEALITFLKDEATPNILQEDQIDFTDDVWTKKGALFSYTTSPQGRDVFVRLALTLKGECLFIRSTRTDVAKSRGVSDTIGVRAPGKPIEDEMFYPHGSATHFPTVLQWVQDHCVPWVREINFENAEAITDEGRPLVLLFKDPNDLASLKTFESIVEKHAREFRNSFTFVHANGHVFTHPLQHLGKSPSDLPLVALDSFKHMYVFPSFDKLIADPTSLSAWLKEFERGDLHRKFHGLSVLPSGPDAGDQASGSSTGTGTGTGTGIVYSSDGTGGSVQTGGGSRVLPPKRKTDPPPSVFINLAPSKGRYSFKDEL